MLQPLLLLKCVLCSSVANLFVFHCLQSPWMSWRILSVKGKRTSSQAGVAAWLPLPTVTVMVLLHHKTPQAAGINSGRGEAQWGWWLCWTCEQGLGVPTEWLGHLPCYSLCSSAGLCRSRLISLSKRVGESSQKYLDADDLCTGRMAWEASAEELQTKQ